MTSNTEPFSWSKINLGEAFRLIDSLFSPESCLQHQILPLSLSEESLLLGMVNPENQAALSYARSQLASHPYSLKIQSIDRKTHQLLFSAYTKSAKKIQTQLADKPESTSLSSPQTGSSTKSSVNFNERPTLIVLQEQDLPPVTPTPDREVIPPPPTPPIPEAKDPLTEEEIDSYDLPDSLDLQSQYPSASPQLLATLPAEQLWQELLIRTIVQGIGRLYFECHPDWGKILWINNGVLQLSLDKLAPETFQAIIGELKKLAQLPPDVVSQPQQGELVRVYRQEQILLRWRVSPNKHGEEGTLQVLRGKALEFYQQRQMDELGLQAAKLAQNLERKLQQISALAKSNPANLEALPTLRQVQEKIRQHLEALDRL